jgi:Tol biopolymer transport system component
VLAATLNGLATVAGADVRSGNLYPIGPTDALSHDPTASGADDRIAFVATADPFSDDYQLVIAGDDGTSRTGLPVTLPDGALVEGAPGWSPDGAWLVFTIGSGDGRFALARVGDRGGEAVVISPWFDGWVSGQWSPDGTKLLAMTSPQGGRSTDVYTNGDQTAEIHVLNPDGSGWQRIVERGCANGVWAPDGGSILFERGACEQPREEAQLVAIDADGANERIVWSGDAGVTGRLSIGWQAMPAGR